MRKDADYYDVYEAARLLGLSPARVRQMLRAGEIEGTRREAPSDEGAAGPWMISASAVHTLQGDATRSGKAPGRAAQVPQTEVPETEVPETEVPQTEDPASAPAQTTFAQTPSKPSGPERILSEDTPSEAAELLSESVRDLREKAEALLGELERLESRLEKAEMEEAALREGLKREKERSEGLRAELKAERSRGGEGEASRRGWQQWLFGG